MRDDEYIDLIKSTSVRSTGKAPAILRTGLRVLSALAPAMAARLAERLFFTPPRGRPSASESAALRTARRGSVAVEGTRVVTWEWPASGPAVLLVHGWGGRGGQLAAFVEPLLARGFAVVTFDAPGHGASGAGRVTLPQMSMAIRAVAAAHAPVRAVIAHSIGATATARALHDGLLADALVFVGAPADLSRPSGRFVETLGFSPRVRALMERRIVTRVGLPWSAFDVRRLAPPGIVPLLVVHDRDDADVPWQDGAAIARAWPGAARLETGGLGHRRVLRDADVVAVVASFVARYAAAPAAVEIAPALAVAG